jgi:hypothetical protein
LIRVNKNNAVKFSRAERNLEFKKETNDSPSPAKYHVRSEYDIRTSYTKKGPTMGGAERKLDFKVPISGANSYKRY